MKSTLSYIGVQSENYRAQQMSRWAHQEKKSGVSKAKFREFWETSILLKGYHCDTKAIKYKFSSKAISFRNLADM